MARTNTNLLKRIIEVQNITLENKKRGKTQEWTYNEIIYPRFFISKATFYVYLARNAKKELKEQLNHK